MPKPNSAQELPLGEPSLPQLGNYPHLRIRAFRKEKKPAPCPSHEAHQRQNRPRREECDVRQPCGVSVTSIARLGCPPASTTQRGSWDYCYAFPRYWASSVLNGRRLLSGVHYSMLPPLRRCSNLQSASSALYWNGILSNGTVGAEAVPSRCPIYWR